MISEIKLRKINLSYYKASATLPKTNPLFTVEIGKQPLIFQKVTYLVTRRIDQIDPKTWLIFWGLTKSNDD